jgi:hypothetical protein
MRRFNKFQRGQGCYKCNQCGKMTRDTNGSCGNVGMCELCETKCMAENAVSDNSNHPDAFGGLFKHCTTAAEMYALQEQLIAQYPLI